MSAFPWHFFEGLALLFLGICALAGGTIYLVATDKIIAAISWFIFGFLGLMFFEIFMLSGGSI